MALAVSSLVNVPAGFNAAATRSASRFSGVPLAVAPRSASKSRVSFKVRATTEESSGTQKQILEAVDTIKSKWETVDDKPTFLLYTGGSVLVLYVTDAVIGALEAVPIIPDALKLVGTLYAGWFAYRYLLFETGRKDLSLLFDDLKSKVAGTSKA